MIELASKQIGSRKPVRLAIVHVNAEDQALSLLEAASAQIKPIESYCRPLSPIVGNHADPGTVALTNITGIT
jgi:fatty acid-binding protein DegV